MPGRESGRMRAVAQIEVEQRIDPEPFGFDAGTAATPCKVKQCSKSCHLKSISLKQTDRSNGAAAARLRQIKPRLLKQLQRDERELNSIRILMQVSPHHNPLHKKKIFLDHTARSALLTLSSRLESSSLRSALIQLANRGATSNPKQETLEEVDSYKNQSNNNSDA